MLRTATLLPLDRAADAGLRPDPFPDRAANLLPGLLAATRTGLTPASDDEHEQAGHLHEVTSLFSRAHETRGLSAVTPSHYSARQNPGRDARDDTGPTHRRRRDRCRGTRGRVRRSTHRRGA